MTPHAPHPVMNDTYLTAQVEVLNAVGNRPELQALPAEELTALTQDAIICLTNIRSRYEDTHSFGAACALELVQALNRWMEERGRNEHMQEL
jgi:hypothetical protein